MKKTIAVIFGGRSVEHDVSIITAHTPIIDSLLASGKFNVVPIYITKDGSWYSDPKMNDIKYFKDSNFEENLIKYLRPISISLNNSLRIIKYAGFWQSFVNPFVTREIKIDLCFPAMHGTYGEDGSLMGLLRMANVPFVGCDIFASAVAMDKVLTKQVLDAEGMPIVPYVWFNKFDFESNKQKYLDKIKLLKYPLFIKPVHLGSSIGITKAKTETELLNAIEVALHYDDKVLVEEAVPNLIEVTLPIMGNDEPILANIERPLNKTEFFDFQDKYLSGGKKTGGVGVNNNYSEIPANISEELSKKVKELGLKTYKTLGCSGIARIDFLIDSITYDVFVNEVNTLPGSLYHHNWKKMGISNIELVEKLISFAEEKFNSQKDITYTFKSDILSKAGGKKLT